MWRIRIIPTIASLTVACTLVASAFAQDTPSPNPAPVQPSAASSPAGRVLRTEPATAQTCRGCTITRVGTPNYDTIDGTSGRDVIHGLGGNDTISGAILALQIFMLVR